MDVAMKNSLNSKCFRSKLKREMWKKTWMKTLSVIPINEHRCLIVNLLNIHIGNINSQFDYKKNCQEKILKD